MLGSDSKWPRRSMTPPCPRIRNTNEGDHKLIVRHVKEARVTVCYPVLMSSNYIEWSLLMKVNM